MKKKFVASILLILIIASMGRAVWAEDLNELYTQHNQIQEQQNAASSQLEIVKSELSVTLQQIQELSQNIDKYQKEVEQMDEKIQPLEVSISELEAKLAIAQKNYEEQKKLVDDRLVTIYENGETTYLDVLVTSKSITDFLSNYYLVSELAKYDIDFLNEIELQKKNIEVNKEKLEKQRKEYLEIKQSRERKALILTNTRTLQNDYMNKLTEEERKVQEQIDLYRSQIAQIESEILQLSVNSMGTVYIGGIMAWPVPGYTRITSSYGMRTHPITGIYKLHTGVDLGAPIGANFIAAADGMVVKAGYNSAYGNMVIIDHGGGISTLYAHGNEIIAKLGQPVKKGDIILKVGQTGYATGPHAHFEVRLNGTPVNPMPFITSNENASDIITNTTNEQNVDQ